MLGNEALVDEVEGEADSALVEPAAELESGSEASSEPGVVNAMEPEAASETEPGATPVAKPQAGKSGSQAGIQAESQAGSRRGSRVGSQEGSQAGSQKSQGSRLSAFSEVSENPETGAVITYRLVAARELFQNCPFASVTLFSQFRQIRVLGAWLRTHGG
jgi:hypothetical protein